MHIRPPNFEKYRARR